MTAPEEPGSGPVIRDHRRIDPVTGQPRRGKHAASQPAGTSGASRSGGPGAPAGAKHGKADEVNTEATTAPEPTASETEKAEAAAVQGLRTQLAERTADLQRLQAEYANYRKRVDRDRATAREAAVASALSELLPVLDAI